MGRTLTNNFALSYTIEASLGVLPGSPIWKSLEPNGVTTFGSTITTVARNPISKSRQRRKGAVTDLDSAVEFDADLTIDSFKDFIEGFIFANLTGPVDTLPTAVTATAFTVPTLVTAVPQNSLVYSRGFTTPGNNGLKVADTGGTLTSVPIVGGLTIEAVTPSNNASLQVTGFRFSSGDLEVDVDGNLITTVKDFAELGLQPGQMIWVGGDETANQFAITNNKGFVRVAVIETNKLTIDKTSQTFAIDDGATKLVELYFGQFVKNVSVDDANYLERSFQFEGFYKDLTGDPVPTGDGYEYPEGNYSNSASFELPLTDKATVSFGFVGTNTPVPVEVQKTGADDPYVPVDTSAFNTSADILRLRIQDVDETGLTTDFKSVTMVLNNNASPEKVLGLLGAKYMNTGNFEVDIESQLLFTDAAVVAAIRNNETLSMDFQLRNDNGAISVDIPALTLNGGDREFPVDESILINVTAQAFGDATYGSSLMVSLFPYSPNF